MINKMREAKIKVYTDKEIKELTNAYNKLVKSEFQIDEKTLVHKIKQTECKGAYLNPDYHIPQITIEKSKVLDRTRNFLQLSWKPEHRSFHYNPLRF